MGPVPAVAVLREGCLVEEGLLQALEEELKRWEVAFLRGQRLALVRQQGQEAFQGEVLALGFSP